MVDNGDWIPLSNDSTIQAASGPKPDFVRENGVVTWNVQADHSLQNAIQRLPLFAVGLFDPMALDKTKPTRKIWCPVTTKSVKIKNGSTALVLLFQFRLEANEKNHSQQYIYSIERLKEFLGEESEESNEVIKSLRRYKMDDKFRTAVHQELGIKS